MYVSRVSFAKPQRPHLSNSRMEILSRYFTPGFIHISPVLCPCIIEKANSFTEQQGTKQAETSNCSSCDGLQTGRLPTLGCSHKLHFKPCRDPAAELGLPRYRVIHVSTVSGLTKIGTQKRLMVILPVSLDLLTALFTGLSIEV